MQSRDEDSEDDMPLAARKKRRVEATTHDDHGLPLLPDEIWLTILQFLSPRNLLSMGATSRRYLKLSRDPELWKTLVLDWQAIKKQEENKIRCCDQLIRRATKLHTLTVNNRTFEQVKSSVIVSLARKAGSFLTRLIFSPEVVLSNTAVALISTLTSLTHLELPGDWIKTAAAQAISNLPLLDTLKMPGAEQVTSSDLRLIASSLHNLRVVDLSDAKKGMTDGVLTALAAGNTSLEYLALDDCESVTSKGLRSLSEHCHKLKHLSLDGCYQVNDPSIIRIAQSCPNLTYLSLGLCSTVKDSSLKALATNCTNLAHLNLFGCAYISEKGVNKLVEALGPVSLRYICIRGMIGIGQIFSEKLVKDWPQIEVLHHFLPKPKRDRSKKY